MGQIRYCRRCGKALAESSRFCDNCGAQVEMPPQNGQRRTAGGQNRPSQGGYPPQNSPYRGGQCPSTLQQPWEKPQDEEDDGFTPVQYVLIGLMIILLVALIAFCGFWIFGRSGDKRDDNQQAVNTVTEQQQDQKQEDVIEILNGGGQTASQNTANPQTQKQTERQTNPQTQKLTEKQTETQTETQKQSQLQVVQPAETQRQTETQKQSETQAQTMPQTEPQQVIEIQQSPNQQVEVHGTSQNVSSGGNGYLSQSSQRALTDADVSGMSYEEMQMAINEIYARHGRIFSSASIQNYFESQSWYQGTVDAEHFSDSVFSSTEAQNIQFLLNKMGVQ